MEFQQLRAEINAVKSYPWRRWTIYALLVLGMCAAGIFVYNRFKPKPPPAAPQVLPEAPKAESVTKTMVPAPKRLEVYDKSDLLKKIPASPALANDSKIQFTSSAAVPVSLYGGTALSFTNMSTGKSGIDYTPKARPWFGFGGKTSIGALGGVSTKGNVAIGYVGQDVVRLWSVNIGVAGGGGVIGADGLLGGVIHVHGDF